MSSLAINVPAHTGVAHTYAKNVGLAARALLAALLAVKPQQSAAIAIHTISPRKRAKNAAAVNRMAQQYDSVMPGLSAELRYIASRG